MIGVWTYVRLGAAAVAVGAIVWGVAVVNGWRERASKLPEVQQEYAEFRAQVAREAADRERQRRIDREIIDGYIATVEQQEATLVAARRDLRNVRLRLDAASVSASVCPAEPAAGTPTASPDRPPPLVAGDVGADEIAERFAVCDRDGARLNSLIEWISRSRQ